MPINLIITGVGGQGNVLASQIIGNTAIRKGFRVTIGETFGLSQRGGPVMSHIRLSRTRNSGPLIPPNMAHIIVGLEPLETIRILHEYGNKETIFIVNSRPIYPLNVIAGDVKYPSLDWIRSVLDESGRKLYWLDATPVAVKLGGPIILNMIMIGALCGIPDFPIEVKDFRQVIKSTFPELKLEANYTALETGRSLISEYC